MKWNKLPGEMPKEGQTVLAVIKKGDNFFTPFTTQYKGDGYFRDEDDDICQDLIGDYSNDISHWMTLPKLPKD